MANPDKGEVAITIDGKPFTLCYSNNSIRQLETISGSASFVALFVEFASGGRLSLLQTLVWGGLLKFHPSLSLEDVEALLDEMTHEEGKLIGEAIAKAVQFRLAILGINLLGKGEPEAGNA